MSFQTASWPCEGDSAGARPAQCFSWRGLAVSACPRPAGARMPRLAFLFRSVRQDSAMRDEANRSRQSRRGFLKTAARAGALATFAAAGMPSSFGAAKREEIIYPKGKAEHCIFIWLGGGAAHIDTWDPKRLGDFKKMAGSAYPAIDTAIPG